MNENNTNAVQLSPEELLAEIVKIADSRKARDIVACAQQLMEKHGGKVPGTMEELTALPGVGRKTANLILGDSRMTTLDKIINLADALEPGREYPGVAEIREKAMQDLDRALLMSLQSTLRHVASGGGIPNRRTEEACRVLEQNLQTNKQENTI